MKGEPNAKSVVCAFALFCGWQYLSMEFFNSAVGVLQTLVIALGAGLGIWGVINLLEGYGNDNPGANAHVTLRSSNKNDKDRRSTLFRTAQG